MSAGRVDDYGYLADGRTGALVSRDGSVDWWCPARFDAPSVFARLLGDDGGHWWIRPAGEFQVERSYLDDTLVLRTVFRTEQGSVAVTDALALDPEARGHDIGRNPPGLLLRLVEGLSGHVPMLMSYAPRFEYGRVRAYLQPHGETSISRATGSTLGMTASVPVRHEGIDASASFTVDPGRREAFSLSHSSTYHQREPMAVDVPAALADTVAGWRSWTAEHSYTGLYPQLVRRSALVLQGLTYQRSGAVVAAATTSLPVRPEGHDNYDYRYVWLRDFSLTLRVLSIAACPKESERLFRWIAEAIGEVGMDPIPIVLGVEGERDLSERELDELTGHVAVGPVLLGNDAWRQRQQDALGQVLDAAWLLRERLEPMPDDIRRLLRSLAEQAAGTWRMPDSGMWELRGEERHYVSSKVGCWMALDRAVRFGRVLADAAELARWAAVRDEIHASVLENGWNPRVGAITGAFGSDRLDASVLVMPLIGFLSAADPRMRATIDRIDRELTTDGLVRRWPDDSAGFVICSFWLVGCLALAGERDRATALFERLTERSNDLGLFAEQIDPDTGDQLGNLPQAFSHIGLISAAWRLTAAATGRPTPVTAVI
ncbi:glycoside hydrolase family 15 protein [Plantactinospora sp. S1510]|uniref:Glycoside hydrolase family 15 protein n=1 Tax=Plantactinospora alkalitolerans TaxID=2789879 RepID=A0ABS0H1I9_9ACTN|nr:glycoside hydrolase family 15 protein [Plantactinospora alkalitolerans]MBF9131997.1 glycoside hydrolase family 15 protein [Plantactinospora alkalitolerans]